MAGEEIVPGVWAIGLGYVNAFLFAGDDGLVLVDSGLGGRTRAILRAVEAAGGQAADVHHILITHHHSDHIGSLAGLEQATGARTYVHAADSAVVRGEEPQPGPNPRSIAGKVLRPLLQRMARADPAQVDVEVSDGQELPICGGVRAVHTPGHTPGHTSFLLPVKRVLFVGDAAGNLFRLAMPIGIYTADREQARESIAKIAALDFDIAFFGHGRVLKGEANLKFRRFAEKLAAR